MNTRDIRTFIPQTDCDVCGRSLLRGEHAEVYVNGTARQSVCELCKARALQEGWVREGSDLAYDTGGSSSDRRRSLRSRLLARRDSESVEPTAPALDEDPRGSRALRSLRALRSTPPPASEPPGSLAESPDSTGSVGSFSSRAKSFASRARPSAAADTDGGARRVREPRHVRAVPTSAEQKIASAAELFNVSEHRRTVSGVARSLGMPAVFLRPTEVRPSVVNIVVSWELCWYRYEVDLSDDQPSVRVAGQGYELDELAAEERQPNAVADERGSLSVLEG
ncbi:MAG: hypothetical protein ACR2OB_10120 [Solirubrobacteraceae bacterium]